LQDHPTNFVFATSPLPTVNSYTWNNADQAYTILGNYATSQSPDLIYPFRSLASQKTVGEHEFTSTVSHTQVELSAPATTLTHSAFLTIPSSNSEEILPATFIGTKQGTQFTISARVSSPEVWDGQKKIWGTSTLLPILTLPLTSLASQNNVFLSINGVATLPLHTGTLGTSFLSLTEDNVLTVGSGSTLLTKQTLPATTLTTLPILRGGSVSLNKGTHHLKVVSPFVNDSYLGRDILGEDISQKLTCDAFRQGQTDIIKGFDTLTFMALNATSCGSLYFSSLPHNLSYLITINHRNLQGRSLHFWILNQDAQYAPIDTYLPSNKTFEADSFVLPPQEAFGQAYSLHFDNTSIGKDNVENEIKEVSITPLPYAFITNLRIQEAPTPQSSIKPPLAVVHPNESLYLVLSPIPSPSTIVLSQAYDAGWQAYVVNQQNSRPTKIVQLLPFFFGQRLTTHVKVNTWENGWKITTPLTTHQQIIIVYLPQYLEYLGWIFLFGGLAGGLVVYFRHKT
ncbi:MAG TPA: hypothetical protein VG935_00920, partial [Patescibacteria group bacterium]|nr:hypothetical protein [Patescibacteria group bacterium]